MLSLLSLVISVVAILFYSGAKKGILSMIGIVLVLPGILFALAVVEGIGEGFRNITSPKELPLQYLAMLLSLVAGIAILTTASRIKSRLA